MVKSSYTGGYLDPGAGAAARVRERGAQVRREGAGELGLDEAELLDDAKRGVEALQPFGAVAGQHDPVGPQALAPAPELVAVGDVERPGALLDGAVQIGDPDLEDVERHRFGERVDLLVDDRAAIGRRGVGDPVDRKGRQVDEPERRGGRGGVGAHRIDEVAQQLRDPGPETRARRAPSPAPASG